MELVDDVSDLIFSPCRGVSRTGGRCRPAAASGTRDPKLGGGEYPLGFQFEWNWSMMFLRPRQAPYSVGQALIDLLRGGHFVGGGGEGRGDNDGRVRGG